jgi:hypothetical protein
VHPWPAEPRALTLQPRPLRRFNAAIFGGRLPLTLAAVTWNAKLKTTAGLTYSSRSMGRDGALLYAARIELSKRVVDDAAKLRQTLCHELCHAAAWLVRGVLMRARARTAR